MIAIGAGIFVIHCAATRSNHRETAAVIEPEIIALDGDSPAFGPTTTEDPFVVLSYSFDQNAQDYKDKDFKRTKFDDYKVTAFTILPKGKNNAKTVYSESDLNADLKSLSDQYVYKYKTRRDNSTSIVVHFRKGVTIPQINALRIHSDWFISRLIFPPK